MYFYWSHPDMQSDFVNLWTVILTHLSHSLQSKIKIKPKEFFGTFALEIHLNDHLLQSASALL